MKSSAFIKQFLSYFAVGGIAALVEWTVFAILASFLNLHYMLATCMAFVVSTTVNWALGRAWSFRGSKKYADKQIQEILVVFAASAFGLLLNVALMYVFVSVLGLNSAILKSFSKIAATGLVFIWNFAVRHFVIYK